MATISATGSDTIKRLAAAMIVGPVTSFAMESLVYPVIYYFYKRPEVRRPKLTNWEGVAAESCSEA